MRTPNPYELVVNLKAPFAPFLSVLALALSLAIALPMGIMAAYRPNTWMDSTFPRLGSGRGSGP